MLIPSVEIPVNRSAATFVAASSHAIPVCGRTRNCTVGRRTISAPSVDWPLPRLSIWRIMRVFTRARSPTSTYSYGRELSIFTNCFLFSLPGARRVACSSPNRHISRTTNAPTAESVRMCVGCATRDLRAMLRCGIIVAYTLVRSHTNVIYVARHSRRRHIWRTMPRCTPVRSLTSVKYVRRRLLIVLRWSVIGVYIRSTDRRRPGNPRAMAWSFINRSCPTWMTMRSRRWSSVAYR